MDTINFAIIFAILQFYVPFQLANMHFCAIQYFNVPQVKQQMFLYKFAECRSVRTLAIDPANPQTSDDRYFDGLRY
jgi:hypothetical protein